MNRPYLSLHNMQKLGAINLIARSALEFAQEMKAALRSLTLSSRRGRGIPAEKVFQAVTDFPN